MTTTIRRLILIGLGILAGVALWPLVEMLLIYQAVFPSYLVFILTLGAVSGLLLGLFFGSGEGITSLVKGRLGRSLLAGAGVGCFGGLAGFLIGQAALLLLGELFLHTYRSFQRIVLPASRAIGWAFLGLFVGMAEGIRVGSLKKIGVGLLGGLLGGLVGGAVFQYTQLYLPAIAASRLLGLVILGLAIGLFYSLIERGASPGVLRLLNGKFKGKEYPLTQNRLTIGRSPRSDICLQDYEGLADSQARLRIKKRESLLVNLEPKNRILVNEQPIKEQRLKYGDVLKIGTAKLIFKVE